MPKVNICKKNTDNVTCGPDDKSIIFNITAEIRQRGDVNSSTKDCKEAPRNDTYDPIKACECRTTCDEFNINADYCKERKCLFVTYNCFNRQEVNCPSLLTTTRPDSTTMITIGAISGFTILMAILVWMIFRKRCQSFACCFKKQVALNDDSRNSTARQGPDNDMNRNFDKSHPFESKYAIVRVQQSGSNDHQQETNNFKKHSFTRLSGMPVLTTTDKASKDVYDTAVEETTEQYGMVQNVLYGAHEVKNENQTKKKNDSLQQSEDAHNGPEIVDNVLYHGM